MRTTTSATAAASAAAGASAAGQGVDRVKCEAHVGQIDIHTANLLPQPFGGAERKAAFLDDFVIFIGFVESEPEMRAAATAGSKVNAHGGFGLVRKKGFEFFMRAFAEFQHETLRRSFQNE